MQYNYNQFTMKELQDTLKLNEKAINILQKEINNKEEMSFIIVVVSFLFSWCFVILGLVSILGIDSFIGTIIGILFIAAHIYCYSNIHIAHEEKQKLQNLIQENEKISLVLELKKEKQSV